MERRTFLGVASGSLTAAGGLLGLAATGTGDHDSRNTTANQSQNITGNQTGTHDHTALQTTEHLDVSFELIDPSRVTGGFAGSPSIQVEGQTIVIRGTIDYLSGSCGTVRLVYAGYHPIQGRVGFLVVSADAVESDSQPQNETENQTQNETQVQVQTNTQIQTQQHHSANTSQQQSHTETVHQKTETGTQPQSQSMRQCTAEVVTTGYQIKATVDGEFSRIVVTEHHPFGSDTGSLTVR